MVRIDNERIDIMSGSSTDEYVTVISDGCTSSPSEYRVTSSAPLQGCTIEVQAALRSGYPSGRISRRSKTGVLPAITWTAVRLPVSRPDDSGGKSAPYGVGRRLMSIIRRNRG